MSEKNKLIVAEPSIPYGNQSWFKPQKYENVYGVEAENIPSTGNTVRNEFRSVERLWKGKSDEKIHAYSIVFVSYEKKSYESVFILQQKVSKKKEFENYVNQWHSNRDPLSSILNSLGDMNYQQIINMGEAALPFSFLEIYSG